MSWHARLELQFQRRDGRTTSRYLHQGPLLVQGGEAR